MWPFVAIYVPNVHADIPPSLMVLLNMSQSSHAWEENLPMHGKVFFHIKAFLGSVVIWTLWDLKDDGPNMFDCFAIFCPQ